MSELIPLLNVEDVDASVAFYETALGARVEQSWEFEGRTRWARVRFDGGALMLNTPDEASNPDRRERGEFSDVVLYLMCADAPSLRAALAAKGTPVGPIRHEEYGNDEFSLRDPDGYAIRFSSPR